MTAAKIIACTIYKGGTGKTTTAVNLAGALAERDYRVLLVDIDQQASATRYLGINPEELNYNLYHVFYQNVPAGVVRQKTSFGIDVLPSSSLMAAIEESLERGDEGILRERLDSLKDEYDYIIIDSPPGKADLTFNGIVAADLLLVPASAERMSIDGVSDLVNHVQEVIWHRFREELAEQEIRVLFTKYKATTKHSPGVVKAAQRIYRDNVLETMIPETIAFPRSFEMRQPLTHLQPKHAGARAYRDVAGWLIDHA